MCVIEFDEGFEVYSSSWPRAAKEHRCDGCRATIRKGRRYQRVFFAMDGRAWTERSCLACYNLMQRFAAAHGFGYTSPSSLEPLLDECVLEGDEDSRRWRRDLRALERRRRGRAEARP